MSRKCGRSGDEMEEQHQDHYDHQDHTCIRDRVRLHGRDNNRRFPTDEELCRILMIEEMERAGKEFEAKCSTLFMGPSDEYLRDLPLSFPKYVPQLEQIP